MATSVKAKKKAGTYDNKLILWISVGLGALVAIVLGIFLIVKFTTNYVAKVDGAKIYTYEYEYFLRDAVSKEYNEKFEKPEGYDDMSAEEQNKIIEEYFTEQKKKECEEAALEEARKFKAEYRIACQNGCKLTSEQRSAVKSNIDYYISMYVSYYGLTQEQAESAMTGGSMSLSEYKDFMIEQSAIENYKNLLKADYKVADDEIKARYNENPDDFRTVSGRVFQFSLPTAPSKPVDNEGKEITDQESEEYKAYAAKVEDYKKQLDNYEKLAKEMVDDLTKVGKFTLKDIDMVTYEVKKEKDDDGNEKEVIKAEDADFEVLCTAQSAWSSASSNKGIITAGASGGTGIDEIDKFLLSAQWNTGRTAIVVTEGESASTSSAEATDIAEPAVTPSRYEIIRKTNDEGTLTALYIVRVEDIDDIDSPAPEGSTDGKNTIFANIEATIMEEMAVKDLEAKVAAGGSKYNLKSQKQKRLDEIMKKLFA